MSMFEDISGYVTPDEEKLQTVIASQDTASVDS